MNESGDKLTFPLKHARDFTQINDSKIEVYDGEIIENDIEIEASEKKIEKAPSHSFAYKLGVCTGTMLSIWGIISKSGILSIRKKNCSTDFKDRFHRHRRRRKGKK